MAVVAEIAALKFKFDVYALPAPGRDLAFRLAIGETGLNRFDHVAQMFRDHPKKGTTPCSLSGSWRKAGSPGALRTWGGPSKAGVGMSGRTRQKGACVRGAGTHSLAQGRRVVPAYEAGRAPTAGSPDQERRPGQGSVEPTGPRP